MLIPEASTLSAAQCLEYCSNTLFTLEDQSSKVRKVRFSEWSCVVVGGPYKELDCDEEFQGEGEPATCRPPLITDSEIESKCQNDEQVLSLHSNEMYSIENVRFSVRTKEQDGPGAVGLTAFHLINKLVKQGTMKPCEVVQILRCCSKSIRTRQPCLNPARSDSCHSDSNAAVAHIQLSLYMRSLCIGVAARLAALRDRILAAGKAALPPSRAVMGPPFVPALDFLRRLVLDAAEPAAAAAAAEIAAAAAAEIVAKTTTATTNRPFERLVPLPTAAAADKADTDTPRKRRRDESETPAAPAHEC